MRRWRWLPSAAALLLPILTLVGGGTAAAATTAGPPPVLVETRAVVDVAEVALAGVGHLVIEQGEVEGLTIAAEAHVLPLIGTEVQNHRLTIRPLGSFTTTAPIVYTLSVKDLHAIEVSGSATVAASALTTDRLVIVTDGSGSVTVERVVAETLEVAASGSGGVAVAGTVTSQAVELGGAATYAADGLASRTAVIVADGAGKATVRVSDELTVRVGGAGAVHYLSTPLVRQEISGAGRVERIG